MALTRKQLLVTLAAATVVLWVVLVVIDQRLRATGGPSIIGLELAGSEARAAEILAEWGDHGRDLARASLWIDFGFMLGYGAFFALAALTLRDFARRQRLRSLAALGAAAAWCAGGAVLFDAVEDVVWLLVLDGRGGSFGPRFATACAIAKFALITLAIAYAVWGGLSFLRHRRGTVAS